jgi:hypothetical protein
VGYRVGEGVYDVVGGAQDFIQEPGSCVREDRLGRICISRTRMVRDWYEGGGNGVEGAVRRKGTEYLSKAAHKVKRLERSIIGVCVLLCDIPILP